MSRESIESNWLNVSNLNVFFTNVDMNSEANDISSALEANAIPSSLDLFPTFCTVAITGVPNLKFTIIHRYI